MAFTTQMVPRIEIAEVVSFRLKLPLTEVERLPVMLAKELDLTLEREHGEVCVTAKDGDSSLRFRPVGHDAVLTEIAICNDEGGGFFQRVLGPLMVRFEGDCELRLVWNTPDRNTHGDFGAVTIRRGQTNYPGLSRPAQALRNALVQSSAGNSPFTSEAPAPSQPSQAIGASGGQAAEGAGDHPQAPENAIDEGEIERLLTRGREQFAEYQRLKKQK
jgi:hypothetical protein